MVRRGIVIPEYEEVISESDENNQENTEPKDENNKVIVDQGAESIQETGEQKETVQEGQKVSPELPETVNK